MCATVLRIVLIVLLILIGIPTLLLLCPVSIDVVQRDGALTCTLRLFWFLRIRLTGGARKRKKTRNKKAAKNAEAPQTPASTNAAPSDKPLLKQAVKDATDAAAASGKEAAPKAEKKSYFSRLKPSSLSEALYLLRAGLDSCGKPMRFLCRSVAIHKLDIDFTIADEDACRCAVSYGAMNALVYNALAWLSEFFRVRTKRIAIRCRYNHPHSTYNLSCTVTLSPLLGACVLLRIAVSFWRRTRKGLSAPEIRPA